MALPSHELAAFRAVAQTLSFSLAAGRLFITQPALSQRIQNLERTLGLTLFVRDRKGVRLTDAGIRLLRYCQVKDHLESELLAELKGSADGQLGGHLRLAAYSSVLHSVLVPALSEFLRQNSSIQFEFSMHEMRDLPGVLERGEADFAVLDHSIERASLETVVLGHEEYVLIQPKDHPVKEVYLDHDPEDRLTEIYLGAQGQKGELKRCYMDDVNGILMGVALGLGQGVVPRHLVTRHLPVRIMSRQTPVEIPIVLHYFRQPHYTRLQEAVIQTLKRGCRVHLQKSKPPPRGGA
jgi:DNA-binding transcriptional LysR family regulator